MYAGNWAYKGSPSMVPVKQNKWKHFKSLFERLILQLLISSNSMFLTLPLQVLLLTVSEILQLLSRYKQQPWSSPFYSILSTPSSDFWSSSWLPDSCLHFPVLLLHHVALLKPRTLPRPWLFSTPSALIAEPTVNMFYPKFSLTFFMWFTLDSLSVLN